MLREQSLRDVLRRDRAVEPVVGAAGGLDLDDDYFDDDLDADTVAGLLLELKGDFPLIHETLTYKGLTFEVLKKEQRRISRVKVKTAHS